ncbi:hypothetical protein MCSF7_01141, partial [Mycoplasmopsis columbina SF7]
ELYISVKVNKLKKHKYICLFLIILNLKIMFN